MKAHRLPHKPHAVPDEPPAADEPFDLRVRRLLAQEVHAVVPTGWHLQFEQDVDHKPARRQEFS